MNTLYFHYLLFSYILTHIHIIAYDASAASVRLLHLVLFLFDKAFYFFLINKLESIRTGKNTLVPMFGFKHYFTKKNVFEYFFLSKTFT